STLSPSSRLLPYQPHAVATTNRGTRASGCGDHRGFRGSASVSPSHTAPSTGEKGCTSVRNDSKPSWKTNQAGAVVAVSNVHRAEHMPPLVIHPNARGLLTVWCSPRISHRDLPTRQDDYRLNRRYSTAGDGIIIDPPQRPGTPQNRTIREPSNRQMVLL